MNTFLIRAMLGLLFTAAAFSLPVSHPAGVNNLQLPADNKPDATEFPFLAKGTIQIGGENANIKINFDTSTSITTVVGYAKAGGLSDLLNAVKVPGGSKLSSWEVTAFTIVFTGKKVTQVSCDLNKVASEAMADIADPSVTDAAKSTTTNSSWMSAKKLFASVDFDPVSRSVTQINLFVALAKENAQVSPTLQFTDATIQVQVNNPFSTRQPWSIGLTGKLTVGAAAINAALVHDSATNVTQIDASITGQPLLTVLRNFAPLVQAPSQLERLDVSSFRLILVGVKIQHVSFELNQVDAATAISNVGGDEALAAAKTAPQQGGKMDWLQLKKVVVQVDFDDTAVNLTVQRIHVYTALQNDQVVADKITFKDAQIDVSVAWPMDKARRVFTTELNGNWVFQAGGVLNCNLKFDGATNTTNLHGSVTGVSLLSVLRQAVPLGKFPSQLERLQVTGANMILINGKVAHIDFELDQLAADVIATVDPNALADAKAESPAKLDWLQLKKVKVEIDFDAQFNVAHLHIFTALAGTPPVAVTNSIVFSDATIEVTVQNIMSPARTYTTELIGNWACGQAGLIKARVHYNSVDKRLEVNSAVTGTGLLTVLRAVVPSLQQAPRQFEALQLTDFTVIVVDRNVTQIRVQLDALPKDALDALGGEGATDKIAPQANGKSWQLTKVAADVTIEYSTGAALVKTVSVGIDLNKDVEQTVTPQIALTGIQTNVIFSDLAAVPTPYTISIAGDWIFADNTLRTTVVTDNTDTVVTAIAGGDGLTVEQAIQGLSKGKYSLAAWQIKSFRVRGIEVVINTATPSDPKVRSAMVEFALDTQLIQGLSAIIRVNDPFTDKAYSTIDANGRIGIVDFTLGLYFNASNYCRVNAVISSKIQLKNLIKATADSALPDAVTELQILQVNLTFDTAGNVDLSGNASLGENGITLLPGKFTIASITGYSQITLSTSSGVGFYTLKGASVVDVLGVSVKGDMELTYEREKKTYTFILHPWDGNLPTSLVYATITNKPQASFESISDTLVKSNFSVKAPTSFTGLRVTELKLVVQSDFKLIILASVTAAVPEPVPTKLPFGVSLNMTMGKIILTVEKPFTDDYKLSVGAEAEWRVKNVVLSVSADLSAMAAGFGGRISGGVAVGSPDQQLGIGDLAGTFGSSSGLSWTDSVKVMKLGGARVDVTWETTKSAELVWLSVRTTGTVNLVSSGTVFVELITGTLDKKYVMVFSTHVLSAQAAAGLLGQTVPQANTGYLAKMPPMQVDIVYSTTTISRTQAGGAFSPKDNLVETANAVIDAGIQISMSYRTPDNGCNDVSGQMLCLIVTKCIGVGAGITIGGYLKTDTYAIGLFASVDNVRMSKTLLMTEAKIFIEATPTSAGVGISGILQHTIDEDILYYTGMVRADILNGIPTLRMQFTSKGLWKNIFGQKFLSLGDANLEGGLSIAPPTGVVPTSFGVGGRIMMGTACLTVPAQANACITASAYIRVDLVDPLKGNYVSFATSALTLATIIDTLAGGGNTSKILPKCIQNSGFPFGISASVAGSTMTLPNGVTIQEGVRFNGTIDFIGYRVSAYIAFIQTKSLDMEIIMDPIVVLGGLFAITERVNDYSRGPRFKLYVDFGKITEAWYKQLASPPKLNAAAAVSVFGFSVGAAIEIGFDKFSVEVTGSLFGGWIIAQVKVYATLDVFGLFANAEFSFFVMVATQSAEQIAAQSADAYKTSVSGKVKTLEDSIAENKQAIVDLEAANQAAKQCYADCGNIQKCTVEFEQCKDPWNTMFYSESCRRTSSCASNERKSQVCTSRPWWAPWNCNKYADQCCSRTLTDSFPAYKATSCKKSYDFCIKPKSSIWDIVGAAFTGQLDVAWCSTKCKASELWIATKVEWLKVKNLALEAINAISKGAQKVWSAIGKYVGMIFSLNNITAYGKLATSGQELTFLVDMKILGIPIKANFTLTPKTGKEIDTKSIAEASYNQTAKVIESSTEEELQLLQLDISGHLAYDDSVVSTVVQAAENLGIASDLAGVGANPADVTFLKLLRGDVENPAAINTSQPISEIFKDAQARAEHVYTQEELNAEHMPTKDEIALSVRRLLLNFVKKPANGTQAQEAELTPEDLSKIQRVLAKELGANWTEYHFLCQASEYQRAVTVATTAAEPAGSAGWSEDQKKQYVQSLQDPTEIVNKYAVRCAVLSKITDADLTKLANALRWYSELQGPSLLGKGHLLRDTLPLEQASIAFEPTSSSSALVVQANGACDPASIKALFSAQTGIAESRLDVTCNPGVSSLIQLQSGTELSAETNEITIDVKQDVFAQIGQAPGTTAEIITAAAKTVDLSSLKLQVVAAVPVTTPETVTTPAKVFDERQSSLSIAAWIGIACGGIAFVALVAVITIFVLRRREGGFTEV